MTSFSELDVRRLGRTKRVESRKLVLRRPAQRCTPVCLVFFMRKVVAKKNARRVRVEDDLEHGRFVSGHLVRLRN